MTMPSNIADVLNSTPLSGSVQLPDWGVIEAKGADARKFLQGQLSQDFVLLNETQARLAAYCTPQGRMLASFIGWLHDSQTVLLLCKQDLLAATLKRLSMFVMRADCKLTDVSSQWQLWGELGVAVDSSASPQARQWQHQLQTLPSGQAAHRIGLSSVQVGTQFIDRTLVLHQPAAGSLPEATVSLNAWQWLDVCSGIAMLSQPVVDAFVPQMLNYESVGGVNFKKGCYPGQEVVARSQYRGILKRRAYIVSSVSPMQVGQLLFQAADAEQPCGTIVAVASLDGGLHHCAIASMQVSAATDGQALHLGDAQGTVVTLHTLPYALLADV
jgi:folate-binding protein YgfZ